MHPKYLAIADYCYELPDERIAKYPLLTRDESKLLIYDNGRIETSVYKNIDEHLPSDTLLVFNNTKVVEARLLFQKETGGIIEIFCLEPDERYADITSAMMQKGRAFWKCLIGGASKWKHGMTMKKTIEQNNQTIILEAAIAERLSDCFIIELSWTPQELLFAELLHAAGNIPLPPYLHRDAEEDDKQRYQTIYAKHEGSVAAPTAGLHFTDEVFGKLEAKGIKKTFVTLHVGAGTFMPVKSVKLEEHEMHEEFIDVTIETIQTLLDNLDNTIVAVGTTSLRTIESLYWLGVQLMKNGKWKMENGELLQVNQWEPYEISVHHVSAKEALSALFEWMKNEQLKRIVAKTQILIAPSYELKIAKGIITNFHQPQSTLLLLVAAIVGEDWKRIYQYALDNEFRFLSYGDGCLLWKLST